MFSPSFPKSVIKTSKRDLCVCVCSLGMEVLEVVSEPDVVVVCCGGGGLLAGVAAAIKLSGCDRTRIYGVEPEGGKNSPTAFFKEILRRVKAVMAFGFVLSLCFCFNSACTMYKSFVEKKPVGMDAKSIASGLAPPFAGTMPNFLWPESLIYSSQNTSSGSSLHCARPEFKGVNKGHDVLWISGRLPFELCQRFVEAVVLVSDEEIKAAVSTLYRSGLVVEPSGSAAFAAIVNNKIPELEGKNVVCILSGGNIGKDELANFPD